MPPTAFLRGDLVTLHPVDEDDLPFARDLLNDPRVRLGVAASTPFTLADERSWYEGLGDGDHAFVIRADGERVGIVGLHEGEEPWGVAEAGYFVSPDHWGNGYATDALRCAVRYGFEERRCNKVEANVYEPNDASRRVVEKVGFTREGERRDHAFVEGEYVDLYEYGLLADEWRE